MAKAMNLQGKWVLVTGASAGLGLEMTRVLASRFGANVVAVARRADRLHQLRDEVESRYGTQVQPLVADLRHAEDLQRVVREATADRPLSGAILNAGVTYFGRALEQTPDSIESLVATNLTSVVTLAQSFAKHMVDARQDGGLMLVSSLASFSPLPYQATYAATKSFVTSFGRALGFELRGTGVTVSVFAPGGIATEMIELSGLSRKFKPGDFGIMSAESCARLAVNAFVQRRPLYVPGIVNQLTAACMKVLPHSLVLPQAERLYRAALYPQGPTAEGPAAERLSRKAG